MSGLKRSLAVLDLSKLLEKGAKEEYQQAVSDDNSPGSALRDGRTYAEVVSSKRTGCNSTFVFATPSSASPASSNQSSPFTPFN